jgi:hypothetical protein
VAKDHGPGLQRNAVGLTSVLFMSVTNMAPGAAVAFSIHFAAPYHRTATGPARSRLTWGMPARGRHDACLARTG